MRNFYQRLFLLKRCFAFVLVALFLTVELSAQQNTDIGTGTVGNPATGLTTAFPCPLQDYYEGSRAQYLYKATELGLAGMGPCYINAIKFNVITLNTFSGNIQEFTVKIGGSSVTTLSATTWEPTSAVVYGPIDFVPVAGVNTITFSTPYFWNGTDNIIIEICNGLPANVSDGLTHWTQNPTIPWTTGLSFNGSHNYAADAAGNLCGITSANNAGTQTTRPNITFNWTPAAACAGIPNAGTTTSTSTVLLCPGIQFTLGLTGNTLASNLTYKWQSSPDNITWTDIPGANAFSYTGTQTAATRYYRAFVTCTNGGATSTSVPVQINFLATPPYTTLPYLEGFEANWSSACATRDVPSQYWKNTPATGNNSWRRNDDGNSAAWTATTGGYTPTASEGTSSARFHSLNTTAGTSGTLDLYVNCNTSAPLKRLKFDFINANGTDSISILLSTDGGTTFTRLDSTGVSAVWKTKTILFTSTSATSIIRFRGVGDLGTSDMGIDNLQLNNWADCTGTPVGGVASVTPTSGICAGVPVKLTLTGASDGNGISYQWQSSTDGGNTWVNIPGATNTTATVFQGVTTQYRCVTSCSFTSVSSSSVAATATSPLLPNGTYTINKNLPTTWPGAGAASNFNSFAAAYASLSCGISSAVVFSVVPGTGPYTEQLIINGKVSGSSTTNTITFQGNDNIITFAPVTAERAVIKLKNTRYFIFDSLRINPTGTFGYGVQLSSDADSNIVRKCIITTSTTSATAANYAGIVISGSDTDPIATGATLCDENLIDRNTIIGGYYGITLTATAAGANLFNKITNNTIQDFYSYGIYVNSSLSTIITGNKISRPTRTTVGEFNGIYFTGQSNSCTISKNRIFNPGGAIVATNNTAFNGINFNACSASSGSENLIINNLIYGVNSNNTAYGLVNTGSSNVVYLHNTVSLDSAAASTNSATRGYSQTGSSSGIFFYNNLISITRGGGGTKHCVYLSNGFDFADNNNYYINAAGGTNAVGFFSSNRLTIANWKTAMLPFGVDQASISIIPVYTDPSYTIADYHPNNAGMDNKGTYMGVDEDIVGVLRNSTTPDIGAYEFIPSPCTLPLVVGNTVISTTSICQNSPVVLGLTIGAYGSSQTFQWQTSTTNAPGSFTLIGTPMAVPDTTILSATTLYYQCVIKCGNVSDVSNAVLLTVSPALPTGTYTIDNSNTTTYTGPGTGTNFNSFADAKTAMSCGVIGTGNVIFSVQPGLTGTYNEQLELDSIKGVNVNRQIVFNGNGNTIAFNSTNSNKRAVIKLDAADFITLNNLKIDASAGTYGYGVQLINNADSNTIKNCIITTSMANSSQNYAGIVINASAASASATGNTFCDGNRIDSNNVIGGYYGITLVGGAGAQMLNNNQFKNNKVEDFYNYGIYVAGTYNTLIESNTFTRPTRTLVAAAYPIYFTTAVSSRLVVSKNRITKLYGGAPLSTSGIYGISHNSVDASAGNEATVSNNLLYNLDGLGLIYAIHNVGSDNISYFNNTISIDNSTPANGQSVGFYQTTDATGIQFVNNIVTIRRAGNNTKQGIYVGSTTTDVTSNYNNFLVSGAGATNYIGYRAGTNYSTLAAWKTATLKDANSLNYDPLYFDTLNGNYRPAMAPLDNMGTPSAGITTDITNANRSLVTPDMGAYEFAPIPCVTPPVAGTASVTPNNGVCLEVPIRLTLAGHSPVGNITFQWQAATSAAGQWNNFGPILYSPTFDSLSSATNFYRCAVTCNGSTTYSTVTSITLNAILLAGTYTIDASLPQTWPVPGGVGTNFQTVQSAVNAILCGMTGSVVFNVKGTYNEQIRIPYIPGTSANSTVTFQSWNGLPSGAELTYDATNSTSNYTLKLDSCKYFTFRNMTLSATNTTNGRVVEFANTASYDSISRCIIKAPVTISTSNTLAAIYANALKGVSNKIKGNTINNGSSGIYFTGTSATVPTIDHLIDSNFVNGAYYYGIYAGFNHRIKLNRNTINVTSGTFPTTYGVYATDCDSSYSISSNKVNINNSSATAYGLYVANCDGSAINSGVVAGNDVVAATGNTGLLYGLWLTNSPYVDVINNTIAINTSNASSYGLYHNNSANANYYNNAVNSTATSTSNNYAGYFLNSSAVGVVLKNNIFSHKAGGRALYINNSNSITSDYNMLYSSGTILVQRITPTNTTYPTLEAWKIASLGDLNSIVYNPAFVSNTDLRPDVNNVDVWAIHGRGIQITSNTYDHDNAVRPVTLTTGVPDLGAYEFYPSTVLPTVLAATPAVPAANTEQTFMYGTDTVMKIKWGAAAPASVEVRRYSGVVPTGLAAQNLDSMYFYTKVDIPGGGNYDYDAKLFYIDPWLGSIGGLTSGVYQLGLGKTSPNNAWVVGFSSRNNVPKRMIYQTGVSYLDKFTGLLNPYAPPVLPDKDSSNRGKRFWVAYPTNELAGGQDMVLYLSAQEAANVQVKINGTTWVRNYSVGTNTVLVSDIIPKAGADNAFLNTPGIFNQGISIVSDVPIVAYAHVYGSASSGASMLMPVGVWGYEYKTLIYKQTWGTGSKSYFYVIADNDNTKVDVTPSVAVMNTGMAANTATSVVLNKGQVLLVMANSLTEELSGSVVKSVPNTAGKCFPVATFSGSARTQINLSGCFTSGGDFIMQQNFPSTAWGKKYLTAPTSLSTAANTRAINAFRVAVKSPTTVVMRNGTQIPLGNLINGHYYEFTTQVAEYIEADQPIMVAQYMADGDCGGTGDGDPEMFYISPIEQGINKVGFFRNTQQSIDVNYLTMIVPTAGLTSLKITDGATLVTPDFVYSHPQNGVSPLLKGVNYSVVVKRFASAQRQVRVECDSNFTGITYGQTIVESYGYNIGTLVKNLQALAQPPAVDSLPTGNPPPEYTCVKAPFKFSMLLPVIPTSITWKFSQVPFLTLANGTPAVDVTTTPPVPSGTVLINGVLYYKFTISQSYISTQPGIYGVQVIYTHPTIESCDNTQTDVIYVQVIPAPEIGFNINFAGCQGNTATFTAGTTTPAGINANSWSWMFSNGTSAIGASASITYPLPGTYTERLKVITADGCIRDTSRQVVVNPIPVVAVAVDSVAICSGSNATFTVQGPLTGATYNWYNAAIGGTLVHTGTSWALTNVTVGAIYYIEGISGLGCTSITRKRVVVNVLSGLTPATVNVVSSNANSVTFGWTPVPNAASYQVSVNGASYIVPSSGATGTTHTVTGLSILTNTSVVVQAIGVIACQTSTSTSVSGCTNSTPLITPDSVAICLNASYTYLVNAPLPANVNYTWYNVPTAGAALTSGTAFTINAAGSSFTANSLSTLGVNAYYVGHANSTTGCAGTTRKRVVINVLAPLVKPVVTFVTTATTPNSLTFTWLAVAGVTNGYQISIDNGTTWLTPSTGANGLSHTVTGLLPNASVTILVKARGILDCQNSISDPVTGKTFTDAVYVPNAFNPNSTSIDNRTLRVYGYVIQTMQFMVFNQWGEKVYESSNQSTGWDGTYKGKQQPSGVYIYLLKFTTLSGATQEMKGSISLIR